MVIVKRLSATLIFAKVLVVSGGMRGRQCTTRVKGYGEIDGIATRACYGTVSPART